MISQRTCQAAARHIPVMVREVIEYLNPGKGKLYLDMTFGGGGHSRAILESADVKLICVDRDPLAYNLAKKLAEERPEQIIPCLGRFSDLSMVLKENGVSRDSIDGVLFDFGCSSMQMDNSLRGFALSHDGPLDMRMDADRDPNRLTAADVIAHATEDDLRKIFKVYGEEKQSRKIARAIVEARYTFRSLETTRSLAALVADTLQTDHRLDKLQRPSHVATRVFQALRIFVNDELNEINRGLHLVHKFLKRGGRLVAITFHSLEDRIVKNHVANNQLENMRPSVTLKHSSHIYNSEEEEKRWVALTKKPVVPSDEEVQLNPRSRSAKLRAAVKL